MQRRATSNSNVNLPRLNITLIGNGKMGSALGLGIVKSNILSNNSSMTVCDYYDNFSPFVNQFNQIIQSQSQSQSNKTISLKTTLNNIEGIKNADIVFLAVKPDVIPLILKQLAPHWKGNELIISIAAGITLSDIESKIPLQNQQRVIRVMPNTPALVSAGASALCPGKYATNDDINIVQTLMECVGICKLIPSNKEYLLNSVTGLTGSGPAYIFMIIEALADGGVKQGLTRSDALEFATQLVYGSAKLVKDSGLHPGILKDNVASPGGTTIDAIASLEKNGLRYALIEAVEAATKKAKELGDMAKKKEKEKEKAAKSKL